LVLLLLSIFWTPLARAAGNAPSVRHMYFKEPLSKLLYFKNPAVILGLDKTSGKVYRSEKYGAQWKAVGDIPEGKAMRMYAHPFEAKIAYVLSEGTEHWLTRDEGKSWEGFSTPLAPTQSGERPLSFHSERTRWVMFIGERCVEETSGWWPFPRQICHDEALYTRDGFEQAPVAKCLWARHTKEFASMAEEAIFCLEIQHDKLPRRSLEGDIAGMLDGLTRRNTVRLVVSEDFFKTQRVVHFGTGNDGAGGDRAGGGVLAISVVKDYVLVAISHAHSDEMDLFVSMDGHVWAESRLPLPPGTKEDAYTILESTKYAVLVDVVADDALTGTLFRSNSNGTYYTLALEHTHRSANGLVDVERVHGVEGVMIANQVSNWEKLGGVFSRRRAELRSRISFNDGARWRFLQPPERDASGKRYGCSHDGSATGECALHVHSVTSTRTPGRVFGVAAAPGVVAAVGSVGSSLNAWRESDTFLSRDGGLTWTAVHAGAYHVQLADAGAAIVLASDGEATAEVRYSLDGGASWDTVTLEQRLRIKALFVDDEGLSPAVVAVGVVSDGTHAGEQAIVAVDFSSSWKRRCSVDANNPKPGRDTERFVLAAHEDDDCVMGHRTDYVRRRADAQCTMRLDRVLVPQQEDCACARRDFECDYGYAPTADGECKLAGAEIVPKGQCQHPGDRFMASSGYRLIPGNTCARGRGSELDEPVERPCPHVQAPGGGNGNDGEHPADGSISHYSTSVRGEPHLMAFPNTTSFIMMTSARELFRTDDEGARWLPVDLGVKTGKPVFLAEHRYDAQRAFVYTEDDVMLATRDRGASWTRLQVPGSANRLHIRPLLDFHPTNADWLLYVGGTECPGCHSEIWVSRDNGEHWNCITTHATKCVFARSGEFTKLPDAAVVCLNYRRTGGGNDEQDRQAARGGANGGADVVVSDNWFRSETVLVRNATDFAAIGEFLLVSQDAAEGKALTMHISLDGKTSAVAQFPGDRQTLDPAYTVLEPPEGFEYRDLDGFMQKMPGAGMMLHVTKNNHAGAEWGSIYASNSNGTFYRRSLEHVNRDENGLVDFERIRALEGVAIANIVANTDAVLKSNRPKLLQSMITADGGSRWHFLQLESGTAMPCRQTAPQKGECSLHLHGYTEVTDPENIYSATGAVGLVMGVGSVGSHLKRIGESNTYLSSDGGATWRLARKGAMWHEFGDHGALIVVADRIHPIAEIEYSLDQARTWQSLQLPEEARSMRVEILTTTPDSTSRRFILYGKRDNSDRGIIVGLDFTGAQPRVCNFDPEDEKNHKNKDDFELFTPKAIDSSGGEESCLLGRKVQYYRRISDRQCYVGDEFRPTRFISNICECTERDYECNQNFIREPSADDGKLGKCVLVKGMQAPRTNCTEGEKDYFVIEAPYRKIPQSICRSGLVLDKPTEVWCPGKARTVAIFW
ncbi:Oligoxyloglucan reducing end-specific cellobiohydrolase, partial [Coemansia reversa NRRL 1564]